MDHPTLPTLKPARAFARSWRLDLALLAFLVVPVLVIGAARVHASTFNVHPVRLFLQESASTTQIELRNDSDETIALQLNAVRWSQGPDGSDVEEATDEVVFFPRIFQLAPHARKMVRVGLASAKAPPAERTWRLYMTQLPLDTESGGTQLRVMLRVGVPIFLAPQKTTLAGAVKGLALDGCKVRFEVANQGTVQFRPSTIALQVFDGVGSEVFSQSQSGSYVLAGNAQRRVFDLPPEVCDKASTVAVHLEAPELKMDQAVLVAPAAKASPPR